MARLLKKIPNDLNNLETTWSSRDEFIAHITSDVDFLPKVKNALPNEGEFLKSPKDWTRHLFMPTGWQLTTFGCAILIRAYRSYRIAGPCKDDLTGRLIVNLNKLVNGPWYVNDSAIYVWDQKMHFELQIYNGDLATYINAYFPK